MWIHVPYLGQNLNWLHEQSNGCPGIGGSIGKYSWQAPDPIPEPRPLPFTDFNVSLVSFFKFFIVIKISICYLLFKLFGFRYIVILSSFQVLTDFLRVCNIHLLALPIPHDFLLPPHFLYPVR